MNLREGARRLALLLGVAGAIVGGFASYFQLQSVLEMRDDYRYFSQLANSPLVQQERRFVQQRDKQNGTNSVGTSSELEKDGIRRINWGKGHQIDSIDLEDGQSLYPAPPGAWSYVLIAVLPILGFFIPWGAVRAIGWVLAGFFQPLR